jgi:hypothetical protein
MAIFREQIISINNERVTVSKKDIKEIFQFGKQPYAIFGTSGSGKTTLALDIIQAYSAECTKIVYMTSTEPNPINKGRPGDIAAIPAAFRRKPSYEAMYGIWQDMQIEKNIHMYNVEMCKAIIRKLYDNDAQLILKSIDAYRKQVCDERKLYYLSKKQDSAEMNAITDADALAYEIYVRLIVDKATQTGTASLNDTEMQFAMAFVSNVPKTLFILDDVSTELKTLGDASSKKVKFNGIYMSLSNAYNNLLASIMTTGRHTNSLICVFIHDINTIKTVKGQLENIVVLSSSSISAINLSKAIPQFVKTRLEAIQSLVFQRDEYKHYFIYVSPSANISCVGKATLYEGSEIELSDINKRYADLYSKIIADAPDTELSENSEDIEEEKNNTDAFL